MNIKFECTGGLGTIDTTVSGKKPIELLIQDGTNNQESLKAYSKSLDYLFRGVTNFASGRIFGTCINIPHLGTINKNASKITWDVKIPKHKVVTYTVEKGSIGESMYYANTLISNGYDLKAIENKTLLKPKAEQVKTNLLKGILCLGEANLPYYYVYEQDKLILKEKQTDKVISLEDIKEDDIYISLKLLNLYMAKADHLGVLLLNCEGFSKEAISFLITMHSIYQKEYDVSLLFLYNLEYKDIDTEKIHLPNIN